MPRILRPIVVGEPHHLVQRGNRREDVFFCDQDRSRYLLWLMDYCVQFAIEILAYCLMANHLHLIAVPKTKLSFAKLMRSLQMRHAVNINLRTGWTGHVWQSRYFSSPLDEQHMWNAIRYVELNPVRAGIVTRAEDYAWSSAASHCGLADSLVLTSDEYWKNKMRAIPSWSEWLATGSTAELDETLRKNTMRRLPCGGPEYIKRLEFELGRPLVALPRGRPRK